MINVGFALTTVGAKDDARESILAGISLADIPAEVIARAEISLSVAKDIECVLAFHGSDSSMVAASRRWPGQARP